MLCNEAIRNEEALWVSVLVEPVCLEAAKPVFSLIAPLQIAKMHLLSHKNGHVRYSQCLKF